MHEYLSHLDSGDQCRDFCGSCTRHHSYRQDRCMCSCHLLCDTARLVDRGWDCTSPTRPEILEKQNNKTVKRDIHFSLTSSEVSDWIFKRSLLTSLSMLKLKCLFIANEFFLVLAKVIFCFCFVKYLHPHEKEKETTLGSMQHKCWPIRR